MRYNSVHIPISGIFRSGGYYYRCDNANSVTGAAAALTLNAMYLLPITVAKNTAIDRISCYVVAAGSGGNTHRMGIYANVGPGAYPGALLVDGGAVATESAAAEAYVPISKVLTRGIWWLAIVAQGGVQATLSQVASSSGSPLIPATALVGASVALPSRYSESPVVGALPATYTGATILAVNSSPIVALRTA